MTFPKYVDFLSFMLRLRTVVQSPILILELLDICLRGQLFEHLVRERIPGEMPPVTMYSQITILSSSLSILS
jgi:hypothetical protein